VVVYYLSAHHLIDAEKRVNRDSAYLF